MTDPPPAQDIAIERIEPPPWLQGIDVDDRDATGEVAEWGWAIPLLHQVLVAPGSHRPFPRRPAEDDHQPAHAYWSALLHLLIYSFGWSRPDKGMRWWYDQGQPVDDPRLRLVHDLWGADGQLDWFVAWLWSSQRVADLDALERLAGRPVDVTPLATNDEWIEDMTRAAGAAGLAAPIRSGAWDPLHLSSHCSAPLEQATAPPTFLRSNPDERRAVLLTDSMVGWYRALANLELPELGERSWHVEVVVRPVGHLGTFRRSRDTGLWFTGPHSLHTVGN